MAEIGLLLCLVLAAFSLVLWAIGAATAGLSALLDWLVHCFTRPARVKGRFHRSYASRRGLAALGTRPYDFILMDAARSYLRNVDDEHRRLLASLPAKCQMEHPELAGFYVARCREMTQLGFEIGKIVGAREAEEAEDDELE